MIQVYKSLKFAPTYLLQFRMLLALEFQIKKIKY